MDRRTVRGLGELLRDPAPSHRRPLALVGRGVVVDAFARALLAGGGDRRALAPLAAAGPEQLRSCVAVIACGLSRDAVRALARARRPFVVVLLRGDDRYAWGTLPGVGAANAIPPLADGSPDIDTALRRLAARLDHDDAVELATRLPVLAPLIETEHAAAAARRAALLALGGRTGGAITVTQARATVAGARVAGLPGGAARIADVVVTAGAGILLREAGRRVPSRLGRAAIAYAGTLVVLGLQRGVRR
jgi:hypothetical protein